MDAWVLKRAVEMLRFIGLDKFLEIVGFGARES
jgi:hypothetical protein